MDWYDYLELDEIVLMLGKITNVKTLNKIREVGLEAYIDYYFQKRVLRKNAFIAFLFCLPGSVLIIIAMMAMGIIGGFGDDTSVIGGILFAVVGLVTIVLTQRTRLQRKKKILASGTGYKEELTRRFGDYRGVLNDIDTKFRSDDNDFRSIYDGTLAVADWLVVVCRRHGVHILHMSEIAGMIMHQVRGNTGYGSSTTLFVNIIGINGEHLQFLPSDVSTLINDVCEWWTKDFMRLAKYNPYMLGINDLILNHAGERVPIQTSHGEPTERELIIRQYLENKRLGIKALGKPLPE